ncbi:MAG: hypothetical protein WBE17_22610 [Anaerolineae bacterium]
MTSADIHVNRHDEIAHFRRMLARDAPRFWFIQGDSGVGKSGLLDYLMDEVCAANGTPSVVFDFKDASPTFIHLAVQTGHQVGVRPHIATERCLHDFGVSGVTVDVRGVRAVVGRVDIGIDASSLGRLSREQMAAWHYRFAEALLADLPDAPAVLFFDTFEKASSETREWLIQVLLPLLAATRKRVAVVMAGQQTPPDERAWRRHLEHTRLTGLSTADWTDYAQRYAEQHGRRPPNAEFIQSYHGFFQGKPRGMVDAVTHLCGSAAS